MVDLRQTAKPRNYLSRGEQWRMLMLVMSLGLVVYLMNEARDPANWAWITQLDDQAAADASPEETSIDNVLPPEHTDPRVPDAFVSPAEIDPDAQAETSDRYFPGVKPQLLKTIRDDTVFHSREYEALYNLLDVLKQTDDATLRKASVGRVSFAQLFKQSKDYRGELVTLTGTIRRAHPMTLPKNEHELGRYYRLWLQPADNPKSPIVIYCLELPKEFPTGMEIAEEVDLTGFFFKRWAYKAQDGLRTAPIVLARSVEWHPAEPLGGNTPTDPVSLLLMFGAAALFAVVCVIYILSRTKADRREEPTDVQLP